MHFNHSLAPGDSLCTMVVDFIITAQLGGGTPLFYCSPEPPPWVSHWWFHMCTHYGRQTHTHTQREKQKAESIHTTLYLSHSSSTWPRSHPDICRNNKRLFLHANTHTFRHAHLPMCSLTLTWVGFPAVQAVSSINMCLLAGDPYVCITGRQ